MLKAELKARPFAGQRGLTDLIRDEIDVFCLHNAEQNRTINTYTLIIRLTATEHEIDSSFHSLRRLACDARMTTAQSRHATWR